ncbi:MAG: hypothetical protein BJ554DRAFT_3713 [Olpidium bornovanus]|uniref:Uncharacterized protein n=1 Tax=Olpidium bornovanus TaxID=278681 RepID=A0A8H7ZNR3_9FUNG|nr:MAG: hypothetical protein BJ554DRAFT_3713 [Olpidium bornovanus]
MRAGDGPAPPLGLDTVAALLDRASVAINAAARAAGCGAQGLEKLRQRPRAKDSPGAGDPWPRKLCSTYGRKRRLRPVGEVRGLPPPDSRPGADRAAPRALRQRRPDARGRRLRRVVRRVKRLFAVARPGTIGQPKAAASSRRARGVRGRRGAGAFGSRPVAAFDTEIFGNLPIYSALHAPVSSAPVKNSCCCTTARFLPPNELSSCWWWRFALSLTRSVGVFRFLDGWTNRAVLVQHLSTAFAYAVFDDPRKLKDFAAVTFLFEPLNEKTFCSFTLTQAQQLTLELARHEFPCTPASVTDMYDFLTSCRRSEDLVLRWRDSLEWENITEQFDKAVDHLARSSLRHAIILAARALEVLRLKFATSGEADDEMAIALQAPLLFRLAAALGKDTAHCWTAADLQPIRSLTELYYDGHPPTPGTLLSSVSIALGVQYLFLNETVRAHAGPEDESAEAFTERVADSAAEFAWAKIGRLVPRWEGWLTRNVCNSKNFYIYIARVFCRRGNFHVPIRLLDDLFDHSAGDPPQPDNRKGSHFGALRVLRRDLAAQAAAETGRKSW